jgi:hypothetical protein
VFFAKAVDLRVNLSGHATRLLQTFFMCPSKLGWIWKRTRDAAEANAKAANSLREAHNASSVSGQYLANSVLFATVLFFASASGKFEQRLGARGCVRFRRRTYGDASVVRSRMHYYAP